MNYLIKVSLLPFIFIFCSAIFAQQADVHNIIENIIEQLSENTEREIDATELTEDLQWLASHQINLNDARREDLEKLSFLSALQVENLMFYLYRHSPIVSIYELQLVEGFDNQSIQNLLPFVFVGKETENQTKTSTVGELIKRGKNNIYLRANSSFEKKAGYKNGKYLGEPFYASTRYLFRSSNRLFWGIVAEKDEGEPFWTNKHKGFDFYSAHFQLRDAGRLKNIVIGDYRASFGLGLVVSNNFLMGKSSAVLNITPATNGLRRSTSLQEYNFLRGVGTTIGVGNFDITAFYSYRKLSATADEESLSSFKTDGLFRTENDREKRNNIGQQILGSNISYQSKYWNTGITAMKTWFDTPVMPESRVNNLYSFRGKEEFNYGWHYHFSIHRFRFAGEVATNNHWHFATLNSLIFNPVSNVGIALLHRDYSPQYHAFYATSFAENSTVQNERGLYIGAEIKPIAKWKISAYADSYRFPYMRYRSYRPSDGYDVFTQLDYAATNRLNMFFRYRYEEQERNFNTLPDEHSIFVGKYVKSAFRYVLNYNISQHLQFRNSLEFNWIKRTMGNNTQGFMMMQDFTYSLPKTPLNFDFRFAVFDAPNYDNRLYTFEKDVLWAFSVPAYYGIGSRMFLNLKYTVSNKISIWLKLAQSIYSDRDVIGSGNEQIGGNSKTDWRMMVQYKL